MSTPSTPGRWRRPGKGLAAVIATGLLLTACGGGGGGAGGMTITPPSAPSVRSMEDVKAGTIEGWVACEMFGEHVRELAEFLDYKEFDKDLFSSNGTNTAGVRICHGRASSTRTPSTGAATSRG